jgi:hypothetical protein
MRNKKLIYELKLTPPEPKPMEKKSDTEVSIQSVKLETKPEKELGFNHFNFHFYFIMFKYHMNILQYSIEFVLNFFIFFQRCSPVYRIRRRERVK